MRTQWIDIAPGFGGHLALPPAGSGPGLVLWPEIFGINAHIRGVAAQYALDGFVVLTPDVFWRQAPQVELGYDGSDRDRAMSLMQAYTAADQLADIGAAVATLRGLAQTRGQRVGCIGYCLGGKLAFLTAATAHVDAAVAYYGGGIHQQLQHAATVSCPVQFHFGERDDHIPPAAIESIRSAMQAAGKTAEVHVYAGCPARLQLLGPQRVPRTQRCAGPRARTGLSGRGTVRASRLGRPSVPRAGHGLRQVPAGVWVLGFVSMLMDISSEMVHSLLPLFMVTTLGASAFAIGIVEGLAEATALIVKVFSGALSDYLGPAQGTGAVRLCAGRADQAAVRAVVDDGHGAHRAPDRPRRQGHPRRPPGCAGRRHHATAVQGGGLRAAAVAGHRGCLPGAVDRGRADAGLGRRFPRRVLAGGGARACWPCCCCWWGCASPRPRPATAGPTRSRVPTWRGWAAATGPVVALGAVFTLARFSEAFLVLRAQQAAIPLALVPLVLVAMNAVYALSAYPFGRLSDRVRHGPLLAAGLVVLIAADGVLASGNDWPRLLLGVGLWGVHMGMTQGPAGGDGGRHRAGRSARHRLRLLQPGQRRGAAAGQRDGRAAVGPLRRRVHLPGRRRVQCCRVAGRPVARADEAGRLIRNPRSRSPQKKAPASRAEESATRLRSGRCGAPPRGGAPG